MRPPYYSYPFKEAPIPNTQTLLLKIDPTCYPFYWGTIFTEKSLTASFLPSGFPLFATQRYDSAQCPVRYVVSRCPSHYWQNLTCLFLHSLLTLPGNVKTHVELSSMTEVKNSAFWENIFSFANKLACYFSQIDRLHGCQVGKFGMAFSQILVNCSDIWCRHIWRDWLIMLGFLCPWHLCLKTEIGLGFHSTSLQSGRSIPAEHICVVGQIAVK